MIREPILFRPFFSLLLLLSFSPFCTYEPTSQIHPRKLVSDELWSQIEPLLPKHKPRPKGGRPRIPDRAALTGIIFVLKTGIPWEDLPQEMGCGSGMTCWRRLRDWQEAGVWENLHHVILQNLHDMKKIDWSRACIDGSVIQAKRGANTQDPTP